MSTSSACILAAGMSTLTLSASWRALRPEGYRVLSPSESPLLSAMGMASAAVFWNSIVGVFLIVVVGEWWSEANYIWVKHGNSFSYRAGCFPKI